MTEPRTLTGHALIASYVKTLDQSPGVYRMLDDEARVLYVGKARDLRARVSNYTRLSGHTARIARMISETRSMMFLTTRTETEALLLEQNLIKQLKPVYNVLLRDDKSFPNILIAKNHAYPQIRKHRGKRSTKGSYFGPFASSGAVNRTLNQLQKVFLLRSCTDTTYQNRTRPCLLYQIKRCAAPCVGLITPEDYGALVADAERFLSGKTSHVQAELAAQMQDAFFIRSHQSWGNRDFYPRTGSGAEEGEILEAFLAQFYDSKPPPRQILLSHPVENEDLVRELLSARAGRNVDLRVPRRGEKAELVENAHRNARESLGRRMSESAAQSRLLSGMADAFDLEDAPRRVEVYDNSHIQGAHAIGAMIVAGPEGFMKNQYRKFTIKGEAGAQGDDFGMMREVLTRRFERLLKEYPARQTEAWPDLLLIDGGVGQVSAVAEVLRDLGVDDVPFIGVAKGVDRDLGREEFHRHGQPPFALRHNDPVLYFVQRLRDEAHRFAIGTHRAARAKASTRTPLDEIPGVGAARKRALLAHFGSAKAVTRAGLPDLRAVPGISEAMARAIHDFFNATG